MFKPDFEIPLGFRQARLVDLTRLDRDWWHVGKEIQLLLANNLFSRKTHKRTAPMHGSTQITFRLDVQPKRKRPPAKKIEPTILKDSQHLHYSDLGGG